MENYLNEIEQKYENELLWGYPIVYKGVTLYPITCENILDFNRYIPALLYDPLRYPTEISTLPRLYFLTDILNHDADYCNNNLLLGRLIISVMGILRLVLREQKGKQKFEFLQKENSKKHFLRVWISESQYVDFKAKDFEKIRQIILVQNGVNYDDTFVHEDIHKWIEEQEKSDKAPKMSIEDSIEAFMLIMRVYSVEAIKKVPIRKFNRILAKALSRDNYCGILSNPMFDGKLKHWATEDNKSNSLFDKYFKEVK